MFRDVPHNLDTKPTVSSTFRGSRTSMKVSEIVVGRPVVMLKPLSKQ